MKDEKLKQELKEAIARTNAKYKKLQEEGKIGISEDGELIKEGIKKEYSKDDYLDDTPMTC